MKTPLYWVGAFLILWLNACTVMPRPIMNEALPQMNFTELALNTEAFIGDTVVLGGYVLSVENLATQTNLIVLHSPLGLGQRPKSKDESKGRMTLVYEGYLDPEVYTKDRKVTVGGRILASIPGDPPPYPHIRIAVRDIHLWPVETKTYDPYDYDDWHPYPWGWRHPWHHRHWHHW